MLPQEIWRLFAYTFAGGHPRASPTKNLVDAERRLELLLLEGRPNLFRKSSTVESPKKVSIHAEEIRTLAPEGNA